MYDPTTRPPILSLNLQINEIESETIELYCLTEIDSKIDRFCEIYHINDKLVIKNLKNRITEALRTKYPFLFPNSNKDKDSNAKTKKKIQSERNMPFSTKFKPKTTLIDTSVSKIGIQNIIYNKKIDSKLYSQVNPPHRKSGKFTKSFTDATKPRFFSNKQILGEKENKDKDTQVKEEIKQKPQLNIELSLSGILKEQEVCSVYNFNNPLLSYSYTNPSAISQKPIPHTTTNKSFLGRMTESDMISDPRLHTSGYSQSKMTKKSSFYEYSNQQSKRYSLMHDGQITLHETRTDNEIINTNEPINNFDNYIFKVLPKEQLKMIFDKLDSHGSGLIGPKNLNLRSLSAEHLKMLEGVVVEIFKAEQNAYFTFPDFCRLVKEHARI